MSNSNSEEFGVPRRPPVASQQAPVSKFSGVAIVRRGEAGGIRAATEAIRKAPVVQPKRDKASAAAAALAALVAPKPAHMVAEGEGAVPEAPLVEEGEEEAAFTVPPEKQAEFEEKMKRLRERDPCNTKGIYDDIEAVLQTTGGDARPIADIQADMAAAPELRQQFCRYRSGILCDSKAALKVLQPADAVSSDASTDHASFQATGDLDAVVGEIRRDPGHATPVGEAYVPVASTRFSRFMINTFSGYSPLNEALLKLLAQGTPEAEAVKQLTEREPDKDACLKRDPNAVEFFYYQKLVRDYLGEATPYRGLLIYHGLGTGKTCTSIAAAEALHWGGKKVIYVLTPATLSNNYRKDLAKCGYFPFRRNNHWTFLKASDAATRWLVDVLGLSPEIVARQGGAWVPNPLKPSNWETLADADRSGILAQQAAHMECRFKFIHYNGVVPSSFAKAAIFGANKGTNMFDDAVVVIDEVHNLVRTINGTAIGGRTVAQFIETVEPRESTWSAPHARRTPGGVFFYPRGYMFYRLLQNAVGAKIVALSATPMINYAQEMAILANIVAGEQRMVEISLTGMDRSSKRVAELQAWCAEQPDIAFAAVEEGRIPELPCDKPAVEARRGATKAPVPVSALAPVVLTLTPVPFRFAKVMNDAMETRGYVHLPVEYDANHRDVRRVEDSNERNLDRWAANLVDRLERSGFLPAGSSAEVAAAVEQSRGSRGSVESGRMRLHTLPLLPEDGDTFVCNFVDRDTLKIRNTGVLKARLSGLVSYYKGGSEELMPRVGIHEVVDVPMSDYMFQEYARARAQELEMEGPTETEGDQPTKRKGMTVAELDLYAQATKTPSAGFLALSRAACNWVFPEDVPRPKVSAKEQIKLLGAEQPAIVSTDAVVEVEPSTVGVPPPVPEEEGAAAAAKSEDEEEIVKESPLDATLTGIVGTLMAGLEAKAEEYLNKGLTQFSPKYAEILNRIRMSPGPALIYSQFKSLEGLGIFAAVLRAADEKYLPLDIQQAAGGEWEIPEALMDPSLRSRPRYILYTGDQALEKRKLLLQLYNADVANLPPKLSAQCAELLNGGPDNRDGRICRVFMITQSGTEGISLFNTRQVHIMEPYWNNVRIQQAIGRAIRLCSHQNLPWEDRVVDIFTYRSVMTVAQKSGEGVAGSRQIVMADKGQTTDEMIFDIAKKKETLADALSDVAKSAAIDCRIHSIEHGARISCYTFDDKGKPGMTYHPYWRRDIAISLSSGSK